MAGGRRVATRPAVAGMLRYVLRIVLPARGSRSCVVAATIFATVCCARRVFRVLLRVRVLDTGPDSFP